MDSDQSTLVLRRFGDRLHGATILTLDCDRSRPGAPFGGELVERLRSDGLLGHVLWSTTCTPADVSAGVFQLLCDAGLFLTKLQLDGVSGQPAKLSELVLAVQTLRRLGILVAYDLDLFGGSPRFAAVRDNVAVLRAIVGDGTTPAQFRSLPADIACSPWLETFRRRLTDAVRPWLAEGGLSAQLSEAWAELVVAERLLLGLRGVAAHRIALQRLTLRCNTELLTLVADSAAEFEASGKTRLLDQDLIAPRCARLTDSTVALRNSFLATNALTPLAAAADRRPGPPPACGQPSSGSSQLVRHPYGWEPCQAVSGDPVQSRAGARRRAARTGSPGTD